MRRNLHVIADKSLVRRLCVTNKQTTALELSKGELVQFSSFKVFIACPSYGRCLKYPRYLAWHYLGTVCPKVLDVIPSCKSLADAGSLACNAAHCSTSSLQNKAWSALTAVRGVHGIRMVVVVVVVPLLLTGMWQVAHNAARS
jgi:hypothetical protein